MKAAIVIAVFALIVVAKVSGVVECGWLLALAPLWAPAALVLGLQGVAFIVGALWGLVSAATGALFG